MKWEDVPMILVDSVPPQREGFNGSCELHDETKKILRCLKQHFRNVTEMEAVLRVAVIVIQAVEGLPDVQVQLQPSVNSHATFYFVLKSNIGLAFIEVKKTSVAVNMWNPIPSVAQAFREAQILLCEGNLKEKSTVPFILTNSTVWSFGLAEKCGSKIAIKENFFIVVDDSNTESSNFKKLMCAVREIIQGRWPSSHFQSSDQV
jgi:hypothetical protein